MASITVNRVINAPIETVFERASDVYKWTDQISAITNVEVLTDGPVGVGTSFRETRVLFKREATEEMTFSEFDPPTGFTLIASSCGSEYVTKHTFEPVEGGTRLTINFGGTPKTLVAKLVTPMMAIMKKTLIKCLESDLNDLAKVCEAENPGDLA